MRVESNVPIMVRLIEYVLDYWYDIFLIAAAIIVSEIQTNVAGWEYSTDGKCEKMPSTKFVNVKIKALSCFEQDGIVWIWPGDDQPTAEVPSLLPPSGFQIHAEVLSTYNTI